MSIGLIISILIRLVALGWSLLLLHRIRDWRMGFLSIMLALMALRQILALKSKYVSLTLNFSSLDTEWPGLIVSIMAFLSVYFVGRILEQRKRIMATQNTLIKELEAQNAELERFTYTISHDLKTPLVTINGLLGYLQRDIDQGKKDGLQSDIAKITKASTGMAQILDELLELAKVGRIVNPFVQVSSAELIEEALKQVEVQLKNRVVSVNLEQRLPTVFVDKTRIQEVFVILIDNSIKFMGGQTDPVIKIGFQNSESEFVFHIKDNGVGIDGRYLEQIFGLFDRLDSNVDGSGVGLTLAKRIIEFHHGKIWAESEGNGLGGTFRFSLPKVEPELLSTG